jgi:hypothetical protein
MRFSLVAAVAAVIFSGAMPTNVNATPLDQGGVTVGVGIICNTSDQMKRLIGLRDEGQEITGAVTVVNDEAKDPRACGIAAVAYSSQEMMDVQNVRGKLVQIVRIHVLAAFDGQRWARVPAMTQYALIEPEGFVI